MEPSMESDKILMFQAKLREQFFGYEMAAMPLVELLNNFAQGRLAAAYVYVEGLGILAAYEDLALEFQQLMSKALEDGPALDAFEVSQISENAKAFAQKVHQKFMEYESIPQNFEEILEQVADNRLQWDQAFERIKHLFRDHQSLINDICAMLKLPADHPKDYQVEKSHISFFERVKAEFADNEEVYLKFLRMMNEPKLKSPEAAARARALFLGKEALYQEFVQVMKPNLDDRE